MKLTDLIGSADQPSLADCRLGETPTLLVLFTDDLDPVEMHWIDDESHRGYTVCPGKRCPVCYTGNPPRRVGLLPVYHLEQQTIQVLRVSASMTPQSLSAALVRAMKGDLEGKYVSVRRERGRYTVEVKPIGAGAYTGEHEIADFVAAMKSGEVSLRATYGNWTARELADVPSVANKLAVMGGYEPPDEAEPAAEDAPE